MKQVGKGFRHEYLVKWIGYARPSWQPVEDFAETVALDEFERTNGRNNPDRDAGGGGNVTG
jgi:hypothetical protein